MTAYKNGQIQQRIFPPNRMPRAGARIIPDLHRRTARAIRQRLNSPKIQTAEHLKIKFLLIMPQLMHRTISRKQAGILRARQLGPQPEKRMTARAHPDPRMKPRTAPGRELSTGTLHTAEGSMAISVLQLRSRWRRHSTSCSANGETFTDRWQIYL